MSKYIPQAHKIAKQQIIDEIRAQGHKPSEFSANDISEAADQLLLTLLTDKTTTTRDAGKLGALARNAKLSAAERSRLAKNAARARWGHIIPA